MGISFFIITILLLLSAFFSASELAIMSVPIYKIKQLMIYTEKEKLAKLLLNLREKSGRTLITILIWNNLVNVILSVYSTRLGDELLKGLAYTGVISMVLISSIVTVLILLFGEIIPKVFATNFSLKFALVVAPIVKWLYYIFFIPVLFFETIMKLFDKILGTRWDRVSKEDIEFFVNEWRKEWLFSDMESLFIKNLLAFEEKETASVLKHRLDVFAFDQDMTLEKAIANSVDHRYSRIPIYKNNIDNIVWIITIRDMLSAYYKWYKDKKLYELDLKPVFKIPITANLLDIFLKMKKSGFHFAIVLDEYGGVQGILTFEDILEEMVGDIKDETDIHEGSEILERNKNNIIIKGNVTLRQALQYLWYDNKIKLTSEEKDMFSEDDMLSYIVLAKLKRFAKKQDVIIVDDIKMEITDIGKNRVKTLKVSIIKK